jgi:flagellar biosynthesis GTPase FlhF
LILNKQNMGAAPFKQLTEILVRCPVSPSLSENNPLPLPKKHKLRKIIQKVQIKKEKADRERKEKKDKERKEREHQREVRKEQRAADQLEKEKEKLEREQRERQRQKEILHQEIRRVGGNVSQIEKKEPPPVPSRSSKPARRTVVGGTSRECTHVRQLSRRHQAHTHPPPAPCVLSVLALGTQRRGDSDSFDGTASDEIRIKLPPTEPMLIELYTKKESIQRGIESLFVSASSQSSEFAALRTLPSHLSLSLSLLLEADRRMAIDVCRSVERCDLAAVRSSATHNRAL